VQAGNLTIARRGVIDTSTFGGGKAGNVTVVVSGALSITGRGGSALPARIASLPSETNGAANAGRVVVQAGSLTLSNGGAIGADTTGNSPGGLVQVSADSVTLRDGGVISSTTAAVGAGGPVDVVVRGDLVISNAGKDLTGISAQTGAGAIGKAGRVTVNAANLTIRGQGQIDATTAGAGDAGDVTVKVPGAILIDGRGASIVGISSGTASGSAGKGGQVVVKAGSLTIRDGGQISSATAGSGPGGDVSVTAASDIVLTGRQPQVIATSTGPGNAGSITVMAPRLILRDRASISTEAQSTDGGNITINVGDLLYLQQRSAITTSVKRADGNGGNITIDPRFVILDGGSVIAANAVGGKGGNLFIRADQFVPSADSAVTATSQRNIPGTITISSQPPNLTGSLVVLASSLRAAAAVLTESCAAHGADPRSSLIVAGRGGLRHDPDTTVPALYFANRGAGAWQKHGSKSSPARPLHTSVSLAARCR
jgi:large exoprotein involved in heme utilization and adhesion